MDTPVDTPLPLDRNGHGHGHGNGHRMPALFVSHGSPMLALEPGRTGPFFERLGAAVNSLHGRPRAIVVVSPHTAARQPVVLGAAQHHAVHDFGGFPDALYRLQYSPPGDPALAARVSELLAQAGIASSRHDEEGLDHGIWSVLRFAWPNADVPVVPVALAPQASTAAQWQLGEALAPLRDEGVLVVGSGSLTHNLRLLMQINRSIATEPTEQQPEVPESRAFRDWVAARAAAGDAEALLDYRRAAPHAVLMHPTDEHWLPFYIAAGAGGLSAAQPAERLHDAVTHGCLAMDAYAFGEGAAALAAAVSH